MMTDTPTVPALVGLGPGPTTGMQLQLARDHHLVGRAAGCDLRLTDAQVGGQHAVVTNREGCTWVRDLGTPGGTFVNGQRLGGAPHPLRRGDVVVFGTVALRLAVEAQSVRPTGSIPDVGPDTGPVAPSADPLRPRQLTQQRDAVLRDIAAARAWGVRMLGCGAAAFVLGFGLFLAGVLGLLTEIGHDRFSQPLGRDLWGVPSGLLGWGISAVGMVSLVAGFALYTVAVGRRRQVERELPWPLSRRGRR